MSCKTWAFSLRQEYRVSSRHVALVGPGPRRELLGWQFSSALPSMVFSFGLGIGWLIERR